MYKYLIYSSYSAGYELACKIGEKREILIFAPLNTPFKPLYENTFKDKLYLFSDINDPNLLDVINTFQPDFIVSCVFSEKIPNDHIEQAKILAVNIHPSALPEIRTGDSSFWNILLESTTYTVTMHKLTEYWDSGDIIFSDKSKLQPYATKLSVIEDFRYYMRDNADRFQAALESKNRKLIAQINGKYYPKPKMHHLYLNLDESANFIDRLIRACNAEISVIVKFRSHQIILLESVQLPNMSTKPPGLIEIIDNKLILNTIDYKLQINVLHVDSYGYISADRFINIFDISKSPRFEPNLPNNIIVKKIYKLYQDHFSIKEKLKSSDCNSHLPNKLKS